MKKRPFFVFLSPICGLRGNVQRV